MYLFAWAAIQSSANWVALTTEIRCFTVSEVTVQDQSFGRLGSLEGCEKEPLLFLFPSFWWFAGMLWFLNKESVIFLLLILWFSLYILHSSVSLYIYIHTHTYMYILYNRYILYTYICIHMLHVFIFLGWLNFLVCN